MEKYDSYIYSGIKSIGDIPSHWEVKHLRNFLRIFSEKGFGNCQLLSVTREKGVILRDRNNAEENHNFVPDDLSGYKHLYAGDFVINKMKSWQGSYGISDYEGIVSPAYFTCKLKGVNPQFFSRALRSKAYIGFFMQFSKGIRVDQWDLDPNSMKDIPFILPPENEQIRIVSYLDEQCSKIDEAIAQQQKMIDLLNERKQIIINNAVTKGLNPNVAMKESGIKWVGHIPSSWQIRSLKRTAKVILGKMLENEYGNKKGYPYLCAKDVHFNSINTDNLKTMLFSEEERSKYKVQKGDLLVVEGGAGGTCAIVIDDINEVYIQNSLMIVRCNEQIATNSYLSYYLQMLMQKGYADSVCNKATIMHFTKEKLCDVPVILPSISQQKYIVEFLDNQLSKIDMVINSLEARKSLLTERKQIIINEVVTGKVKV